MDSGFNDITPSDGTSSKNLFRKVIDWICALLILFAIFSIIITSIRKVDFYLTNEKLLV